MIRITSALQLPPKALVGDKRLAIHIGTSGWSYDHWEGVLYPHKTPLIKRLNYYLEKYKTVEVNSTYYRWPRDTTFAGWYEKLPENFLMTVKAPRWLTHYQRLQSPEAWIDRISNSMAHLQEKAGILLVQLSPNFECKIERLTEFLDKVPRWIKLCVEFRHPSWHTEEIFNLLETKHAAYCVMSGANLPCILRATTEFVYVRLHGPDPGHLYGGSYSRDNLGWWADRIREWSSMGLDVFAYFNNDWEGNAVRNALTLSEMLNV
jgi:uncharacterized protein YecE (DUF72 family)